jgi:hypothetical protein
MQTKTDNYTAIDLLEKILEFTEMTPDKEEWNYEALQSNPPRYIRLQRIEALMKAFFADDPKYITIQSFLSGEFIKDRDINQYENTVEYIKESLERYQSPFSAREIRLPGLAFVFHILVDYKRLVRKLVTFNSGWLEAGMSVAQFSIYLTESISENLRGKYNDLDTTLELFINPRLYTFTIKELIEKYGYPKDDLDSIDTEFA